MVEAFKAMGVARLGAMAGMTAALFGFFAYIVMGISEEPMSLLYAGLDSKDASAIIAKLDAGRIPYKLESGGSTIMVASDQALRLRMEYAGQGLPAGGNVGYEIFDSMDAFGQTSFVQNINMIRALEGELSRTIRALDQIGQARVHLVLPKKELFAKDTAKPSASVVVKSRGGRITPSHVQSIQHLVASAVPGLTTEAVTIIDERGTLLASGTGTDAGAARLDDRTASYEQRLGGQVEDILSRIVGPGRARVQVTAELDFSKITKSSESFDPDGQVVRKTETVSEREEGQNRRNENGVSVTTNLPPQTQSQPSANGTSSTNQANRTSETIDYEVSKTTQTEVQEAGRVKRLSIAVVVDGTYTTPQGGGDQTYAPRSADEMKEIEALVKSAIGFDEKRGDQVKVTNLRFQQPEAEALTPEEAPFLGLEKGDIWKLGQYGGLGLLALLMIFFVFRPLIRAFTFVPQQAGALQSAPALTNGAAAVTGALPAPQPGALPAPGTADPSGQSAMIDIAQIEGQVKESSVRKVGEIVTKHPEEATAIMRQWLHESP